MKNTRIIALFGFVALLLIAPLAVSAYAVKTDNSIYIGQEETINGNLYAAGNSITVDGTVTGDVFCAGQTVNINGKVAGDVFCAGEALNITGEIGGSARVAGNAVNITGTIARNVQAFGATVNLGPNARVDWDMFIVAAMGDIRGYIGRDLHGAAGNAVIAGKVGGDVKLRLDERIKGEKYGINYSGPRPLRVLSGAEIGGNLFYTAGIKGDISDNARISGETGYSLPKNITDKKDLAVAAIWSRIVFLFAALVVGLVLISIGRKQIIILTDLMLNEAGTAVGWGIIISLLTPIICLILVLTLIGIPLALILLVLWLIVLYLSKIVSSIAIGRVIMKKIREQEKESLIWAMVLGIVLGYLAFSLPLAGWLISLAAVWWGFGSLWLYHKKA
ncbi:MAG: polymer-forming cytoskeletal protein [Candidatus Falkowbacteria bacterium]